MSEPYNRRHTDVPNHRTERRKRQVSERHLKAVLGATMWFSTTAIIIGASFVPQIAPDDVNTWRLILGVPAVLFGFLSLAAGLRLREEYFQLYVELSMFPALIVNLVILQITPATQLVLISLIVPIIYAGYFCRLPALLSIVAGATAIAISTEFTEMSSQAPHLTSYLVVYISTIWMTAALLHLQNTETMDALSRARDRGFTDPLTGLANLRALERAGDRNLTAKAVKRSGKLPGLLLIDLDNFKSANTRHGHTGGDYALRMIAHQLMRVAPKDAVVARVGGDEFAVLLKADSRERIAESAQIFRAAVRAAGSIMELDGVEIDAAVGMAAYPEDGRDLSELLDTADKSMYAAKGKKQHAAPDPEAGPVKEQPRPAWLEGEAKPTVPDAKLAPSLDSLTGGKRRWLGTRTLYARTSALAYAVGSIVLGLSLLVPDAVEDPTLTWWMVMFGGLALTPFILLINAKPQTPLHFFFDNCSLFGITAIVAMTGGLESTTPPILILLVASQAWFWQTRLVAFRMVGPVLVAVAPVFYAPISSSQADVTAMMTLFGLAALIVTIVASMYFDRVMLSHLQKRAEYLATTDPLTGISNRRSFDAYVQRLLEGSDFDQFAIVMIDLDNFKQVNTQHGHRTGDKVLRAIAAELQLVAREDDCVARVGGDEFAAVLPGVGIDGARSLAERFVEAVAGTMEARDGGVGASAGFALSPLHGESLDELVFTADSALMAVKASGKGTARVARVVNAV